uniref:Uncharacterized protein n=1 Tax=Glossina brevipalpis TaxID=37001 RepID=A0A1A9WXU8_9MUSC
MDMLQSPVSTCRNGQLLSCVHEKYEINISFGLARKLYKAKRQRSHQVKHMPLLRPSKSSSKNSSLDRSF